jgi:hypothetical protein
VAHVLPLCPLPPLHWWFVAQQPEAVVDSYAHFVKQSAQQRVKLAGATGSEVLTWPVAHPGRIASRNVRFSPHEEPAKSWSAVATIYGGAPYFEHIAPELQPLWMDRLKAGESLLDACDVLWRWVAEWTGWSVPQLSTSYVEKSSEIGHDLRSKTALRGADWNFTPYPQVFSDRAEFVPGCSVLDALMTLGPALGPQLESLVRKG